MLMVIHGLPGAIDAFVWITPVILAILIRPYLIDYVYKI